ncbi:MAG TPA: hypothetical protein GX693_06195 [Firmicutes bacterium]|nr:hypothetical protein [Bacillota bacterium]
MKAFKCFTVLVLVLLLLAAAGCGGDSGTADPSGSQSENGTADETGGETGNETSNETGNETGGETVDADVNVKVVPPEGWEEHESRALVHYMKGTSSFMIVRERVGEGIDGLDGYLEYAKEALAETFSNTEFGSVESLKVDGHDSRKFTLSCEASNMPFKYLIVYVFRDGYVYNLQGGGFKEDVDALLPEFEEFISSFRFE